MVSGDDWEMDFGSRRHRLVEAEMDVVKMSLVNLKLEEGLASMLTSCPEARARKDPIMVQAKAFRQMGY